MGLLSLEMAAELDKPNPSLRRSLSFDFPDGTRRYSDVALCSDSLGFHEPLVKRWGTIADAIGDSRDAIQIPAWQGLEIIDQDKDWSTRGSKFNLKGTVVTLRYCSMNVAPANWLTRFVGILKGWSFADEPVIGVTCGPDDRALLSPFPKVRLSLGDFPKLPKDSPALFAPISPYGRHDSFGIGSIDGQIAPIYVGEYTEGSVTGSKYVIGLGPILRVLHAYANGVRLAATTWSATPTVEVINGRAWSRIQFNSKRSTQEITLDVEGIEVSGTAPPEALIADPVGQIRHLLAHFVYFEDFDSYSTLNRWSDVGEAALDIPSLTESQTYLLRRIPQGYRGGRYLAASEEPQDAIDVLNEWLHSQHMKAFWTYAGKLAIRPDNLDDPGYIDTPWIRHQYHELTSGPLKPIAEQENVIGRVMIEGAYGEALGTFQEKLLVVSQEQEQASTAADSVQGPWLPAYI